MDALKIENLRKTYGSSVQALRGVSFSVKKGDFFGLLGPNGAGKTTIIGILTSLVNKTSGQVSIYGYDIDTHFSEARSLIGVVPQEFNFGIFEKVIDILRYQAGYYGISWKIAKPRAEKYLKALDLWEKRNTPARFLSGGMKRRLMIARALLHDPQMLILDEPTAGVDIELRRTLWKFLTSLNDEGKTIILTTHYLEDAENFCRNIAIIDEGVLIKNCNTAELLRELDRESFVFYLKVPMTSVPNLKGYKFTLQDPLTLEVEVSKEFGLSDLFEHLKNHNIEVASMRNKANRLEELFLRLTANDE